MSNTIFNTPYDTAPFSQYKASDYKPAIERAIQKTLSEIKEITENNEEPTFENTIEALAYSGEELDRLTSMFFNINSAETNEIVQQQAQEISPILSDFSNDIKLNQPLFERIKSVYNQKENLNLSAEQQTLLEKTYQGFARNGANLSEPKKQELRNLDKELSKLSLTFGENVLAQMQAYELHITDEEKLRGLPEFLRESAAQVAEQKGKKGWIFTLDYPSFIPFMTYAEDRNLRKQMFLASGSKAFKKEVNDNQGIVLKIAQLRQKRAEILGYKTHAEFVLEERMAKDPETVLHFLEDLLEKAKPAAKKQLQELQDFARDRDGLQDFQKWDTAFYSEKLKQQKFNLDDEKLKPYFPLENTVKGMFEVANKLYGLQFNKIENIDVYHEEVTTYQVTDQNQNFVALFYTDFHPRPGKRNGAWMTSYKNQYKKDGENSRPHISIVCNFTRPTKTKPSLLTFNEVTTLFHEFGHALHGMLADTTYPNLSGTSVYWDFVELPSQLMENWCYEKEALSLFARHYQTQEVIPNEFIESIKASSSFMEGLQTIRQLSFGILDMAWHHHTQTEQIKDVKSFEDNAFESTELYPKVEEVCMSTAFSHIFQGGYSSGYYSYKWAEVLEADIFEVFKEKGIFNSEVASSFKENILSKGGSEHPMTLYKRFRGKEPSPEALLKRSGLL